MKVKSQIARKDYPEQGIGKGDKYYSWKFRNERTVKSLNYPSRQQLTRSDYLISIYVFSDLEDFKGRVEDFKDEQVDKLQNMPEQLQDSSVLNERIETLETAVSELEDTIGRVDTWKDDYNAESLESFSVDGEERETAESEVEEILNDLQNISFS